MFKHIDEQNMIRINYCDKQDMRYDDDNDGVYVNSALIHEIRKERKKQGLSLITNKRYKYKKYNNMFVKRIKDGKEQWNFIQEGYLDFDWFGKNKWTHDITSHDKDGSSIFGSTEWLESIGFDFSTLTTKIPEEFNNPKSETMMIESMKNAYTKIEKREWGFERIDENYPEWIECSKYPKIELNVIK